MNVLYTLLFLQYSLIRSAWAGLEIHCINALRDANCFGCNRHDREQNGKLEAVVQTWLGLALLTADNREGGGCSAEVVTGCLFLFRYCIEA